MRKLLSALVVLCFCLLTLGFGQTTGPVEGANILTNSSFEQGVYSPASLPDDWSWDTFNPTAIHTWDQRESKTGNRSVKITSATPNDARWIQNVPVEQNKPYSLSGWVKTENVGHSSESVDLGANISLLGGFTHSPGILGTTDWKRTGVLFNSGSNQQVTVAARLGFFSGTTTGTA